MSNHTLALFAHIVGVLGLYAGLALDWATICVFAVPSPQYWRAR